MTMTPICEALSDHLERLRQERDTALAKVKDLEAELCLLRAPLAQRRLYCETTTTDSVKIGSLVNFIQDPTDPTGQRSIAVLADATYYQGVVVSCPSGDDPYCGILMQEK